MPKITLQFEAVGDAKVQAKVNDLNKAVSKLGATAQTINPRLLNSIMDSLGLQGSQVRLPNQGGPSHIIQSDKFMAQARLQAQKMGQLNTQQQQINWRQIAASAAIAPFHPWVAARGIAGAFGAGHGGGGGGGAMNSLFGAGGFFRFEAALLAITTVIHAAKFAFHEFMEAIHKGTRLFEQSAHVGQKPGRLAGLFGALDAVGISGTQAERLLVRGEYPLKSGGKQIKLGDQILGSGRGVFQAGELQQIKNLIEYINIYGQRGAYAFKIMGQNAKAAFDVTFAMKNVTREWDALMSEIISAVGPALVMAFHEVENAIRGCTVVMEGLKNISFSIPILQILEEIDRLNKIAGVVPSKVGDFKGGNLGQSGSSSAHNSPWEKMGFVIGGTSMADYARQTAENTKTTNTLLGMLVKPDANSARGLSPFSKIVNAP